MKYGALNAYHESRIAMNYFLCCVMAVLGHLYRMCAFGGGMEVWNLENDWKLHFVKARLSQCLKVVTG